MKPYCDVHTEYVDKTWPSRMIPGDQVCEDCHDYEDWWLSLTPEQRRADHEAAAQYGECCD